MISVEEINQNYEGEDLPERIKQCIYTYYLESGPFYVLLGGDDTIVPTRYCQFGSVQQNNESIYPTDLYYSCFDKNFQWNANHDNFFGTNVDDVSTTSQAYVTRLPIRTPEHINNYLTKLIAYERGYNSENWSQNILMAGAKMSIDNSSDISKEGRLMSDSEAHSEIIYNDHIKPYWMGERIRFFDTFTDLGGPDYELSSENLQTELEKGPMFVNMFTHGNNNSWKMEEASSILSGNYSRKHAFNLISPNYTFITSASCYTNMFDEESSGINLGEMNDPCLSEAFIRGKENGVIGYIGWSRELYYVVAMHMLGGDEEFVNLFYDRLFNSHGGDNHYGQVVADTKNSLTGLFARNILYNVNPIGDPEMNIFTEIPRDFDDICIYGNNGSIVIETGTSDALIAITNNDTPTSEPTLARGKINTFIPSKATVCITKQNYKPLVYNIINHDRIMDFYQEIPLKDGYKNIFVGQLYYGMYMPIESKEKEKSPTLASVDYINNQLILKFDGKLLKTDYYTLSLHNLMETYVDSYRVTRENEAFELSSLKPGMYVVSLNVNGERMDSRKIFIKP